jgi:hypothetical protein
VRWYYHIKFIDIYDVAIISCQFEAITGTSLKVLSGSIVTVIDSLFYNSIGNVDGVAISLTSSDITSIDYPITL